MTRQIKRKSELYKNLMNPDMLVPIKIEKPNENNTRKTKRLATKREGTIVKTTGRIASVPVGDGVIGRIIEYQWVFAQSLEEFGIERSILLSQMIIQV